MTTARAEIGMCFDRTFPAPLVVDLARRLEDGGADQLWVDGLVTMPPEWWTELAPIGTLDDARAHLAALEAAGARSIGLRPLPDVDAAMGQIDDVLTLARRR